MELDFGEQQPKAEQTEDSEWTLRWAVETMGAYGVLPQDLYLMTIGEANLFLTYRSVHEVEQNISSSWRTINFLGAFLSDKFQNLEKYLPETPRRKEERDKKKAVLKTKITKIGRR